ncbi:helix-turn-helix domain-containing protein [Sinomicrobium sp. M5D2P17]
MPLICRNNKTASEFRLILGESNFNRRFYGRDRKERFLTIAWNRGKSQTVVVDGIAYDFPENSVLALIISQTFDFSDPESVVAWQFNREFYCIVDHDREVGCVGFLFYGSSQLMFVDIDETQQDKLNTLLKIFQEEFEMKDIIQEDMLRVLLKRLIIIVTRLAKKQYLAGDMNDEKLDIIRKFNLLVETYYKKEHGVKFYADQLCRSPKTLSNLFAMYNNKSPLSVIQYRIVLEAKRLLMYTDKSIKEIAYELGYDDAAYFSNFFKKQTSFAPSEFKSAETSSIVGI